MSTAYVLRGTTTHITTNRLWKWLKAGDINLGCHSKKNSEVVDVTRKSQIKDSVCVSLPDDGGFAWFYQSGKRVWHSFERFGMNDVGPVIDFIEAATGGYTVSEHDEDFFR